LSNSQRKRGHLPAAPSGRESRSKQMRTMMTVALAAGALALGWVSIQSAQAADMSVQQGQVQAPPGAYPPPPVGYYAPPPVAYYPPPVAYYAPGYVVWPGPYYGRWGYWRGYGPRFAYGYGRWGHGWHR
jgi:hypothetical protein